jgi:hypothetical protein
MSKKHESERRKTSRSVVILNEVISEKGIIKKSIAEATGLSEGGVYQFLSGRSEIVKRPELLARIVDAVDEPRERFDELARISELSSGSLWLFNALAASKLNRKQLVTQVLAQAKAHATTVKFSGSLLDKILRNERPFPNKQPELVRILVDVLGTESGPPRSDENGSPFDLAAADLIIRARAIYKMRGTIEHGVVGQIGAELHRRDLQIREAEAAAVKGKLSKAAKSRYRVIDRALELIAGGDGFGLRALRLPEFRNQPLALLLLGLVRPNDEKELCQYLGDSLGLTVRVTEQPGTGNLPTKIRIRLSESQLKKLNLT